MLALLGGFKVTMIDFVKNSLDERVKDVMAAFHDQTREGFVLAGCSLNRQHCR